VVILQILQLGRIISDGDGDHRGQRGLRETGTWNAAVQLRNQGNNFAVLDVHVRTHFDRTLHLRIGSNEAFCYFSCRLELNVAIASNLHGHLGSVAGSTNNYVDVVLFYVEHRGQLSLQHSLRVD
jgi:hypothetical protein